MAILVGSGSAAGNLGGQVHPLFEYFKINSSTKIPHESYF
jgi:hypothetical protein